MTDLPDWSSSVNIQAGSVTITAGSLVLNYPAGTPIDPRSIRALTTTDQVAAGNLPAGLLNTQQPQSQPSGSPMTFLHNATSSGTFTVPQGTHAISFLFVPNIGLVSGKLSNIQVKGVTSGASYKTIGEWDLFSTGQGQLLVVPIDSAVDTQITISAGWTDPTIDVKCYVAAILDTTAVYVGNSIYDPISVEYSSPAAPNGTGNPVTVRGAAAQFIGGALATIPATYDGYGCNAPAAGVQAKVVLAALPNETWRAHFVRGTHFQATATMALGTVFSLLDGAATLRVMYMSPNPQANGAMYSETLGPGVFIKGTAGNSMTWQSSGGSANVEFIAEIGAYQV